MRRILQILTIIGFTAVAQIADAQWGGGGGGRGGRGGGGGGRDDNRPMAPDEIKQRLDRTEGFLKDLDANHNGMIDTDEASSDQAKNSLDRIFGRANMTPHYPIAIKDIMAGQENYYKNRGSGQPGGPGGTPGGPMSGPPSGMMGFGAPQPSLTKSSSSSSSGSGFMSPPGMGFGQPSWTPSTSGSASTGYSRGGPPGSSPYGSGYSGSSGYSSSSGTSTAGASSVTLTPETFTPLQRSGRFLTARERLPKGLPSWFLEKDLNGDGQITMDEYTTTWTPEKAAEFDRYDLNHDGIITAEECLKVEKKSSSTASSTASSR